MHACSYELVSEDCLVLAMLVFCYDGVDVYSCFIDKFALVDESMKLGAS
jgi:hypothetical protein